MYRSPLLKNRHENDLSCRVTAAKLRRAKHRENAVIEFLLASGLLVTLGAAWAVFRRKPASRAPEPSNTKAAETAEATPKKYGIFLDVETTGLDPENDRITEICVVRAVYGEKLHDGLCTLINPGRPIPLPVVKLTGITDDMVKDRQGEERLHEFFDFIGDDPVYAYNTDFDMGFLRAAAKRLGRTFNNESRCILEALRRKHPNLRSYKLADACAALGIPEKDVAHRAQGDTVRAIDVWNALVTNRELLPGYLRVSYRDFGDDNDLDDYAVYGHFNQAGECFYVRTVRDEQSPLPDKDNLWQFYTEHILAGKYEVELLEDEITFKKALSVKDKLLKKYKKTALNRVNQWRSVKHREIEKHRALTEQFDALIASGKLIEKERPDEALAGYRKALAVEEDSLDLVLEEGLFGEVAQTYGKAQRCNRLVTAVDRITMVLCREKRYDEAIAAADDLFTRYPGANKFSGAAKIQNRIAKAKEKANKNTG